MENLISASEICLLIEKGQTVYVSEDNCYSSTEYNLVHRFLDFVHCYENKTGKKVFFKREKFDLKRYIFSVKNEIYIDINSYNYKSLD